MKTQVSNLYASYPKFLLSVDCIVFGFKENKLFCLLIKRNFEPEIGKWSLVGGFLNENENLNQCASRVVFDLTGLDKIYLEQLETYSEINRDWADRVVSVSYFALINLELFEMPSNTNYTAKWFEINEIPELIFDHNKMINNSLQNIRSKIGKFPIAFSLLSERFSLPKLQNVYEAILSESLDKRNFRKNMLASGLIKKLEEKDKTSSKKGAYLYSFNQ
ncbi:MAG: NUDIX domain-containing protein [Cytophagales bacterium]|nr:MAG: NUDIX domain-containing protein [Cytophagales bacterium]